MASARYSLPRSIRLDGWACRTSRCVTSLGTIAGTALPHRLYQFAFAPSGWRHACIVLGGESFQALASGLQEVLWMARGVPEEHRTDSLSAAFNNLAEQEELTARYRELCAHYGLRASRNNPGVSHENGSMSAGKRRQAFIDDGRLKLEGTAYVFQEDILFESPSSASDVVVGASSNGWMMWKAKNGKTLEELKRNPPQPPAAA